MHGAVSRKACSLFITFHCQQLFHQLIHESIYKVFYSWYSIAGQHKLSIKIEIFRGYGQLHPSA